MSFTPKQGETYNVAQAIYAGQEDGSASFKKLAKAVEGADCGLLMDVMIDAAEGGIGAGTVVKDGKDLFASLTMIKHKMTYGCVISKAGRDGMTIFIRKATPAE